MLPMKAAQPQKAFTLPGGKNPLGFGGLFSRLFPFCL